MITIQNGSATTTYDDVIKAMLALLDLIIDSRYVTHRNERGEFVIDRFDRPAPRRVYEPARVRSGPSIRVRSNNDAHVGPFRRAIGSFFNGTSGSAMPMLREYKLFNWGVMKKRAVLHAFQVELVALDTLADDLLDTCDEQSFVDAVRVYLEGGHSMPFEFMLATIKAA